VFQRLDDGELVRHAIYMEGTGLWGPVSAYIAVDPPGETVLGTTFFGPLETPGLGAEIHEKWFRDQFIGKKVVDESGAAAAVMVAKGKAADVCPDNLEYCVDGIAGSTLTGDGINEMFERCIEYYEPFFTTIRTP